MRDAEHARYRLIRAGGAALGAETRHITKIERGAGPRHWEAANKKQSNNKPEDEAHSEGGAPKRARDCGGTCGGVFRNRMAAENEAAKNIKIKIRRRLKRLENIIKNATINEKRAALTDGRWDGTGERWGHRGSGRGAETRHITK